MPTNLRYPISILAAGALTFGLCCMTACSSGSNGAHSDGSRHVTGVVDLAEAGITAALMNWTPEETCIKLAKFKVDIADGSGKVLYVATSTAPAIKPGTGDKNAPGADCIATYEATVPSSPVYVIKVEQTTAIHPLTINDTDIPKNGRLPDLAGFSANT